MNHFHITIIYSRNRGVQIQGYPCSLSMSVITHMHVLRIWVWIKSKGAHNFAYTKKSMHNYLKKCNFKGVKSVRAVLYIVMK